MSPRKKRAEKIEGVYQRADGRWQARLTLPDGRRKSFYGATAAEADDKRTEARKEIEQGILPPPERMTVKDFAQTWLSDVAPLTYAPATVRLYTMVLQGTFYPLIGDIRLARLTPLDVQHAITSMNKELAPATVKRWISCLRVVLEHAVRMKLRPDNPARPVTLPKIEEPEFPVLTDEEIATLIAAFETATHGPLLATLLLTGLRIGEVLALTWNDIDLTGATLFVSKGVTIDAQQRLIVRPPKTKKSRRGLVLPPELVKLLKEQRRRVLAKQLLAGEAWPDQNLVFPSARGTLLRERYPREELRGICDAHELPHLTPHDLRHLFATILVDAQVNARIVADSLGHTTVAMTLNTYTHKRPKGPETAAAAMSSFVQGARGSAKKQETG